MSAGPVSSISEELIYVRLMDEGTDVFRPVRAVPVAPGRFRLLATEDYNPGIETWEFEPGSIVAVTPRSDETGTFLVAASPE